MINKGEVPEGYKKTKVGIIPEDWEVKRLGEIADVKGGKRIPKGYTLEDENNGYPYITVSDMYMGGVSASAIKYVPLAVVDKISNYRISKNDIFISVAGTLGIVGIVPEELDGANLTENADKITNIKIEKDYLLYVCMSNIIQKEIKKEKTTNAQPKLALKRIRNFDISIPYQDEQQKIAQILSTWDEAIELKEKLIEEKKEQKKGLMQKLLTGEVRLPGFDGEWEEVRLEDVAECLDNKRIPLNSAEREKMKGDIPYYGANGIVDYINDYIFDEKLILLAEDGGNFDEFSTKPIAIRVKGKSWVNNHAHILRPLNIDYDYLFYELVHKDIRKYINGTTRSKLTRGEMIKILILAPKNIKEQKSIAQILTTADKEIDLLTQELEQLKLQKKGLMQLLLTGIIRVKS